MVRKQKLSDMELDVQNAMAATKNPVEKSMDAEVPVADEKEAKQLFSELMKAAGYDPAKDFEQQVIDSRAELDAMEQVAQESIQNSFKEAREELPQDVKRAVEPDMNDLENKHQNESKEGMSDARDKNELLIENLKAEIERLKMHEKKLQDITIGSVMKNTGVHIKTAAITTAKRGKELAIEKVNQVKDNAKKFARSIKELPTKTEKSVLKAIMQSNDQLRLVVANYNHKLGEQQIDKISDIAKELEANKAVKAAILQKYEAKREKRVNRVERIFGNKNFISKALVKSIDRSIKIKQWNDYELNHAEAQVKATERKLEKMEKKQNRSVLREAKYSEFATFHNKLQTKIEALDKKLNPVKENTKEVVREQDRSTRDDECR